jgi:hypothetical protein
MACPAGQARPNATEAAQQSVTSTARRCPENRVHSSLSYLCKFPSGFTAATSGLATARKAVVRSEVPQREAALERPGILRTAEPIASLAAG